MGTGVSPYLWSPTNPGGAFRRPRRDFRIRMNIVLDRPAKSRGAEPEVSSRLEAKRNLEAALRDRGGSAPGWEQSQSRPLIGAIKPSTVRTAQLRAFLPVH